MICLHYPLREQILTSTCQCWHAVQLITVGETVQALGGSSNYDRLGLGYARRYP